MNSKVTLVLVLLLVALAGYVYASNRDGDTQAEPTKDSPLQIYPTPYGEYDIVELEIAAPPGLAHFARTNETPTQDWQMTQPTSLAPTELDQVRVNGAATRLGGLTASQVITGVTNLAQYGLAPSPQLTVTLTISNGQKVTLYTGNQTPVAGSRYIRTAAATESVYLVPAFAVDDLLRLITEPPLAPTPLPDPGLTPAP